MLGAPRAILAAALAAIVALAWLYLLTGAGTGMDPFAMTAWFPSFASVPGAPAWTFTNAVLMVLMWWVMMIAMMLPSAAPFVLIHARVAGRAGGPASLSAVFLMGYLSIWLAFSIAAACLQWAFEMAGLMHAALMWSADRWLSAGLLVAAGFYQLTPVKSVCLSHCRSPVHYLSTHWRAGHLGALKMGIAHGIYCLGCCWLLMALLFVGGAMNLLWIAGLSIVVLIEKLMPVGVWFSRVLGVVLVLAGALVTFR